jgi:hypothetical protein
MGEVFQLAGHALRRGRFSAISRQSLGSEAGAFDGYGVEQVRRLDRFARRHRGIGPRHDAQDPRGHKDAVPEPVVPGAERSPEILDNLGRVRAVLREARLDARVVLLKQGE